MLALRSFTHLPNVILRMLMYILAIFYLLSFCKTLNFTPVVSCTHRLEHNKLDILDMARVFIVNAIKFILILSEA